MLWCVFNPPHVDFWERYLHRQVNENILAVGGKTGRNSLVVEDCVAVERFLAAGLNYCGAACVACSYLLIR